MGLREYDDGPELRLKSHRAAVGYGSVFGKSGKTRFPASSLRRTDSDAMQENSLFLSNPRIRLQNSAVAATKKKAASKAAPAGNLFAIVGTDDGRVKEEALKLC